MLNRLKMTMVKFQWSNIVFKLHFDCKENYSISKTHSLPICMYLNNND